MSSTRVIATQRASKRGARRELFRANKGATLLPVPALIAILALVLIPLIAILVLSIDPSDPWKNYSVFIKSSGYRTSLFNTFEIAIIVTALCLLLGFPYAWCMAYSSKKMSALLLGALMVPLWTSMLVRTYAWLILLNPHGVINQLLQQLGVIREPLELVHNRFGVLIGMTQILLPLFVLPLFAVMRGFDTGLVRAAKSLGASPRRAFFSVFVPGVMPGIVAGAALVFIVSIGFFVTPALLGGGHDTMLSQLIERQFSGTLNWGLGSAMASVLLLSTLVVLILAAVIMKPRRVKELS
jgi:putative spermidine/putrescine transport system permease protein